MYDLELIVACLLVFCFVAGVLAERGKNWLTARYTVAKLEQ